MTHVPPPASRPPSSLRRRVVAAFTEHLALKATALLFAVVLWFVVNAKEPEEELVPVRFIPTLDSTLVLRDPPAQVYALVAGPPRELLKLGTTPLVIRRQIAADSPDTLVIDLRPSDVALPDGVDAVVHDVSPHSLTLRFESTWTRKVAVRSAIQVIERTGAGPVVTRLDPDSVQITGPRHRGTQIPSVRTVRTTIAFPDSLPHLVDIDTTALGPGVRARPPQVKVLLTAGPPA
jgi:hypothetical protein